MTEWRNGAPYEEHNAFTGALLIPRDPEQKRSQGRNPKHIRLPGSMLYDSSGRLTVRLDPKPCSEICKSDAAKTARIKTASVYQPDFRAACPQ